MMPLLAVLIAAHGIAHLPGFAAPWGMLRSPELGDGRRLLRGRLRVEPGVARLLGVAWLLTGVAFLAGGVGMGVGLAGWEALVLAASLASLPLTLLFLPQARVGAWIDGALIAALIAALAL